MRQLFERYGGPLLGGRFDEYVGSTSASRPFTSLAELTGSEPDLDEFAGSGVDGPATLGHWFEERFFFGCESDDPLTAWAFDPRAGVRLRAMFGSDIGHFDVVDMARVLPEAHELVDRTLLSPADFQDFVFGNVVRLHTAANPSFFAGTIVEHDVASAIAPT
jgi:hypothetical protein